jgi:hypothetical protein
VKKLGETAHVMGDIYKLKRLIKRYAQRYRTQRTREPEQKKREPLAIDVILPHFVNLQIIENLAVVLWSSGSPCSITCLHFTDAHVMGVV